jgi:hypothetical protein
MSWSWWGSAIIRNCINWLHFPASCINKTPEPPLTEYSTQTTKSLLCASVLSVPWSLVYSLLGKDNQYIFLSLIALNLVNLLFSVMGDSTCYCPDPSNSNVHLVGPTQACCNEPGASYGPVLVGSDCRRQIEVFTDMIKMDSAIIWLMLNNLWIVALVNMLGRVSVLHFRVFHHGSPLHRNT